MLLLSQRQSLHALAAEALEVFYTDDLRPYYGEVAYHLEKAQVVDKARRYLRLAGDAAKDGYQNSLAIEYYTRATQPDASQRAGGALRFPARKRKALQTPG